MSGLILGSGTNIATARRILAKAFHESGCDAPELDARLLIGHALGLDHTGLVRDADRALGPDEAAAIRALAARRIAREPVARILGEKEFWGLRLQLSPATLVPRPETETLVEAALEAIGRAAANSSPLRIADLGTGSGAILLALLVEIPNSIGVATDRSTEALTTARRNAIGLGLHRRSLFLACDFGAALAGGFDIVVSNPPYVARGAVASLEPEVGHHDPALALDGGNDGLDAYRVIAADAERLLAPDGLLILEMGAGQSDAVASILAGAGFATDPPRPDLAGIPRCMTARRAMSPRHP